MCCSYLVWISSYSPLPFSSAATVAATAAISNGIREDSHLIYGALPISWANLHLFAILCLSKNGVRYHYTFKHCFENNFLLFLSVFHLKIAVLGFNSWTNREAAPTWGSHIEVHCQDVVSCDDLRESIVFCREWELAHWTIGSFGLRN